MYEQQIIYRNKFETENILNYFLFKLILGIIVKLINGNSKNVIEHKFRIIKLSIDTTSVAKFALK